MKRTRAAPDARERASASTHTAHAERGQRSAKAPENSSKKAATKKAAQNGKAAPVEKRPMIPPPRKGASANPASLALHTDDLSSDDEEVRNTIGGVPLEWYKDYDHIGYDVEGRKLVKSERRDGIDSFLASADDPSWRWTIYDEENDEEYTLTKRDVQLLQNIRSGTYAHPEFAENVDLTGIFTSEVEIHPLSSAPEPKRRFVPSKWEMRTIYRIAKAIKEGRYAKQPARDASKPRVYLLWGDDDKLLDAEGVLSRGPTHIPAPKPPLPGHAASYNPPPEYLFTSEEREAWEKLEAGDRRIEFMPQKYGSLRLVPAYPAAVRERFERCLDLYLCPRYIKNRLNINPESLLPKLPDPSELRPFPTSIVTRYNGHTDRVRSVAVNPTGAWLASASDDGSVRVWDVATGRCAGKWDLGGVVHQVAWSPNPAVHLLAAVANDTLVIIFPGMAPAAALHATFNALTGVNKAPVAEADGATAVLDVDDAEAEAGREDDADGSAGSSDDDAAEANRKLTAPGSTGSTLGPRDAVWDTTAVADLTDPDQLASSARPSITGVVLRVQLGNPVRRVAWHSKGDYIATTAPGVPSGAVMVHQLSKHASHCPFKHTKGLIQLVQFHPKKPLLYVANQHSIRVYDLVKSALAQKLESGVRWISSFDIHPNGDHVALGSYDAKTVWFDTELSSKPYKTLRYHASGVRRACLHQRYPLMATAGDDGTVHIFHARVFDDLVTNPVIVPVKILRGHTASKDGLGVLDCAFHPQHPWIFTAGADGGVALWHDTA